MQLGTDKIEQRLARMEKESGEGKEKGESKDKEKPDSKEKEKEKESADDPQFVKDLLALHDKFINVVNSEFCGNALFQKALKDAFVEVKRGEECHCLLITLLPALPPATTATSFLYPECIAANSLHDLHIDFYSYSRLASLYLVCLACT